MSTLSINANPRLIQYLVQNQSFEEPLIVIDIGARHGFEKHWDYFENSINIIGFEPDETEAQRLEALYKDTPMRILPYALHKDKGLRQFYETALPDCAGFLEPKQEFLTRFCTGVNKKVVKTYPLPTIDLDSVAKQENLPVIDFIKIDTEGCEFDILQGAEDCIQAGVLGFNIEAWMTQVHRDQGIFCDIDRFLRDRGYEAYDMTVNRYSRKAMPTASTGSFVSGFGQVLWSQVLYFKDAVRELKQPHSSEQWTRSRLLKMLSLYELFNLTDCAAELLITAHHHGLIKEEESEQFLNLIVPTLTPDFQFTFKEYQSIILIKDMKMFIDILKLFKPEKEALVAQIQNDLNHNQILFAFKTIMNQCAFLLEEIEGEHHLGIWLGTYYQNLKTYENEITELAKSNKLKIN